MSNYKDIRRVSGGLDTDSDLRDLADNDFLLESANLSSGVSIKGTLLNIKGNSKVSYNNLWTGENHVIGALRDIKHNAIIYFVWNGFSQHSILQYFCADNAIVPILAPSAALPITNIPFDTSFLGFTQYNKIHSANILDDILLWTDGNVAPRKINIKYAKDFMLQLSPNAVDKPYSNDIATSVLSVKEQFIDSIKYAPVYPPTIALGTDDTRNTNFIRNNMIQVRYRWIYDDNEKSKWGTGSYVSLPESQQDINGPIPTNVQNNYLATTINTGHPTVRKIDIAFRFGNLGNWLRLDEPIQKFEQDNTQVIADYIDYTYNFYNDRVLIPIDTAESDELFDAIPLVTPCQAIIDGNRLVYANNTEGYENPQLDVSLSFGNTLVPVPYTDINSIVKILDGVVDPTQGNAICFPYTNPGITLGDVITFHFVCPPQGFDGDITYTVQSTDLVNYPYVLVQNILDYIHVLIGTSSIGIIVDTTIPGSLYRAIVFIFADGNRFTDTIINRTTLVVPSFKKGTFQKFAIAYYDKANRDGGAATNPDMQIYIPTLPELFALGVPHALDDTNAFQTYIDFSITHIPPIWADSYQILKAKNNLSKYGQFILKQYPPGTPVNGNIEIDLTYNINYIEDRLIQGSLNFQFEKGDRVRFIANNDYYCPKYVEVEALSFNATNNILTVGYFDWNDVYGNMAFTASEYVLMEYFAYSADADPANEFYFERGESYDIIEAGTANRRHAGFTDGVPTNQVPSLNIPAVVRMRRGDTYQYRRFYIHTSLLTVERIVESENYSDFYASNNFDISRVQGVRNETTKQHGQQLRYGGRYFADTLTNNLLSFNGSDFDTLQTTYGNINKIVTVGYVLKCLQTKKVTSIYINRQMIFNADGTSNVTLINQVLGTKDPSNLDYGCIDPCSVCVDERQMYFFDRNTGTFVQDSANGLFPVSNYKFVKGMRDKTKQVNDGVGNIFVYASYDNLISTVVLSFVHEDDPTSPINDTYIYNTNDNRWKPKQNFIPEYLCSNALVFVSFKNGELYTHNTNNTRNNFYGVQYDSIIATVSNVIPERVKVFDSLWERSTHLFSAPTTGDISIPPTGNYTLGMASRLLASKFVAKEGNFYSDFLRNAFTANQPSEAMALVNGDKLRGQALKLILSNDDTVEITLYEIIVNSTISDMS